MPDNKDRIAFEPFGSIDGILRGEPFKILPTGKWYREDRVLDITSADLKEMERNFKAGLPRYRVPINLDHKQDAGKVGTVQSVAFMDNGPDGPGLYATKYELTDKGKKAIREDGYDAPSGEVQWSKNGSKYQDPQTGTYHDNLLSGIALTPKPFFGHSAVALFSADPLPETLADMTCPECGKMVQPVDGKCPECGAAMGEKMTYTDQISADLFKDYNTDQRREMARKGWALPDGSYPIADGGDLQDAIHAIGRGGTSHMKIRAHIMKRAKALGMEDKLPADWQDHMSDSTAKPDAAGGVHTAKGAETMANEDPKATPSAPETMSADQFAAYKTEAEAKQAKLAEQLADVKKQAETFAVQLAAEKDARRTVELRARYETFSVGEKVATLAEKFLALEKKDPELFAYFDHLLDTISGQVKAGALFAEISRGGGSNDAETLEAFTDKLLAEKFGGDRTKYEQAFSMAGQQRPDLLEEYKHRPATK